MARGLEVSKTPIGGYSSGSISNPAAVPAITANSGINSAASDIQDLATTIKRVELQHDQLKVVKAETSILASTDAEIAKLDPLDKDYLKKVEEVYKSAKTSAQESASLSTREAKDDLEARLTRLSAIGQVHAVAKQRGSVNEEAVRTVNTASNEMLAKIRRDPQAAPTYLEGFKADAAKLTEGMAPDTRRKLEDQLKDTVVTAQALGYADRGNYAAAKKVLDDNMGTLNPAQEQKARYEIRAIEEKQRTDAVRYNSNVHADVVAKIIDWKTDGNSTSPPPFARADLEKMRGQFTNNPSAWLSMVGHLDEAMASKQKAQVVTREALQNAENRSLRNQSEADIAFNAQHALEGKKPAEALTPDLVQKAGIFARDQGYVPSVYKSLIENAGRTGGAGANTPEEQARLASATAAYDKINELAPQTKWGFADEKGSRVMLTSAMAKSEQISLEEASRRVLTLTPSDEATLASRAKAFEDAFKLAHGTSQGQTATRWTTDQVLSAVPRGFVNHIPLIGTTPNVPPEVAADYKKRLEQNYLKVPDFDTAKKATDKWMEETYSVTRIGDRNEVVKYAPEKYIDPAIADRVNKYGMTSRVVQDDVERIFRDNPHIIIGRNPYNTSLPGWRLHADDQTAKEADKWAAAGNSPDGTSTRQPVTYRLQVLDQFGTYQDVNGPRYRPPNAQEIASTYAEYIVKERADKAETTQPGEAAAARARLTRDRTGGTLTAPKTLDELKGDRPPPPDVFLKELQTIRSIGLNKNLP